MLLINISIQELIFTNIEIEKEIVDLFIQKNFKQRVLFELSSTKRRSERILRLDDRFDSSCITDISKSVDSYQVILKIFQNHGAKSNDDCYFLDTDGNGKIMQLEQALAKNVFRGFFLIYWMKGQIAFWEGERYSAPPRYILKKIN